jgi:hypothetical protein
VMQFKRKKNSYKTEPKEQLEHKRSTKKAVKSENFSGSVKA